MSSSVKSSIDAVLEQAVASGAVPNVVAVAADRDGIIYEGAAGPRVAGQPGDVDADSHFRIMSMTKMVATVAALLIEQGKLDLDAPIEEYCPEFAKLQVLERIEGDRPVLRAPASQATVRQLITHTTGLGYWFWSADLAAGRRRPGLRTCSRARRSSSPRRCSPTRAPRFQYGINTDWLGEVVEAAGGRKLDAAIKAGITEPLGMNETSFAMTPEQRAGSVPVHLQGADGAWAASEIDIAPDPEYWAGGHGLYSTPHDYLKFQRALLGNGTSPDGVEILASATVDAAFLNQIGELDFPSVIETSDPASTHTFSAGPGHKWGYGLLLNTEDQPGRRRAGSGAWAGLLNTHFWVDRTTGITGAIYTQFLPFVTSEAMQMYSDFETQLYASV